PEAHHQADVARLTWPTRTASNVRICCQAGLRPAERIMADAGRDGSGWSLPRRSIALRGQLPFEAPRLLRGAAVLSRDSAETLTPARGPAGTGCISPRNR